MHARRRMARDALRDPMARAGAVMLVAIALIAVLVPLLWPLDPMTQDLADRLSSPSWEHPMGTDELGRDVLARIAAGAPVTIGVALAVVLASSVAGTAMGVTAGYIGGMTDEVAMRVVDIFLAFPAIVLALVVSAVLGPGPGSLVLALSLTQWPSYARLARGQSLRVRESGHVEAARALRAPRRHIVRRHVLPHVYGDVVVYMTLDMATVIVFAAALSFLGLGIQPPEPEWGSMLRAGVPYLRTAPHVSMFPGVMIMLAVLAFNFIGDGIRGAIDPHRGELVVA